jgi:mono/diheme cytochrome c family protein
MKGASTSARRVIAVFAAVVAGTLAGLSMTGPVRAAGGPESAVSFKEDVQPVLRERCVTCHSPNEAGTKASGLDLTNYTGVMAGTKYGRMVVPGDPDSSNLMRLLDWRVSPQIRMPHGQKQLSVCDRDTIRTWIRQGAKNN